MADYFDKLPKAKFDFDTLKKWLRTQTIQVSRLIGGTISAIQIVSSNWDGDFPPDLTTVDASATQGFALDSASGSAQFEGDIFLGGDIEMASTGKITTAAASAQRVELNGTQAQNILFYTADADEEEPGRIGSLSSGSGDTQTINARFTGPAATTNGATTPQLTLQLASESVDASSSALTATLAVLGTPNVTPPEFKLTNGIVLMLENGSASRPSLSFNNDSDSGFYKPGDGSLAAAINGSEVARFTGTAGQNLQGLAWTTWTPTLTNLTLGSGTQVARYRIVGDTCEWYYQFVFGSGSAVGTDPQISVPVAAATHYTDDDGIVGDVQLLDSGAFRAHAFATFTNSITRLKFRSWVANATAAGLTPVAAGGITATAPFTWASGDKITAQGSYEIA